MFLDNKIINNPPFIKSPNFYKGRLKKVELIVLHTMESPEKGTTAESVAKNWFGDSDSRVSAHYCIDNNSIVQCVYDSNTAWHCKNANSNGIGIELAGTADQSVAQWNDEYSLSQMDITAQICAYLSNKFKIPVRKAEFVKGSSQVLRPGFVGHVDVPGHGSHYDPGPNFPWSKLFVKINEEMRKRGWV